MPLPTKAVWPVMLPGSDSAYTGWINAFTALTIPAQRAAALAVIRNLGPG